MGYEFLSLFHGVRNFFRTIKVLSQIFTLPAANNSHNLSLLLSHCMSLKACWILIHLSILLFACTLETSYFSCLCIACGSHLAEWYLCFYFTWHLIYILQSSKFVVCFTYCMWIRPCQILPLLFYITCGSELVEYPFPVVCKRLVPCGNSTTAVLYCMGMDITESFSCCPYSAH